MTEVALSMSLLNTAEEMSKGLVVTSESSEKPDDRYGMPYAKQDSSLLMACSEVVPNGATPAS